MSTAERYQEKLLARISFEQGRRLCTALDDGDEESNTNRRIDTNCLKRQRKAYHKKLNIVDLFFVENPQRQLICTKTISENFI